MRFFFTLRILISEYGGAKREDKITVKSGHRLMICRLEAQSDLINFRINNSINVKNFPLL